MQIFVFGISTFIVPYELLTAICIYRYREKDKICDTKKKSADVLQAYFSLSLIVPFLFPIDTEMEIFRVCL